MTRSPWNFVKAALLYTWMCLKGLPILFVPFYARLVTDADKEVADIQKDLATLRRLLHLENDVMRGTDEGEG
jgi:hypothetical protein